MNCQQARQLLLLWIGHDLADASEAKELESHVAKCKTCRSHHLELQQSLDALQSVSTSATATTGLNSHRVSLWPRVSASLPTSFRHRDRFNGWLPATAVALAAGLMVAVSVSSVQREFGSQPTLSWQFSPQSPSSERNLFVSDPHFTPGAIHHDTQSPLKPASNRLTPEW